MTCYIAADHAGFTLKQQILAAYPNMINLGTNSLDSVDYPDFAQKLADRIQKDDFGILICGSGLGICMAANRFKHVRAANCISIEMAKLAREHNDANVLCLPGRVLSVAEALAIVEVFLITLFSKEPRYQKRIDKMLLF
ncbi:MAG: RpiB/LacA/LacB family sugar-phosphate isomerase [Pseudomonadota bacterium]